MRITRSCGRLGRGRRFRRCRGSFRCCDRRRRRRGFGGGFGGSLGGGCGSFSLPLPPSRDSGISGFELEVVGVSGVSRCCDGVGDNRRGHYGNEIRLRRERSGRN